MSIHEALDFDREKVSIITPCHNAEGFISETYKSLIDQSYKNWEWIVFDDQSSDNSFETLKAIAEKDSRVLVQKNKENSGAAVTRNNCLGIASGKYFAFLDVDDLWYPNKLEKQIAFMQVNNVRFSFHPYMLIDSKGISIKEIKVPSIVSAQDLLKYNPFATSSVIVEKTVIDEIELEFKAHLRRRQDYLFWYEAIEHTGVAESLQESLSYYRVFGDDSLSGNKKKMALIQWKLYREEFHLNIFRSIYYFIHYALHGIKKYFF